MLLTHVKSVKHTEMPPKLGSFFCVLRIRPQLWQQTGCHRFVSQLRLGQEIQAGDWVVVRIKV